MTASKYTLIHLKDVSPQTVHKQLVNTTNAGITISFCSVLIAKPYTSITGTKTRKHVECH